MGDLVKYSLEAISSRHADSLVKGDRLGLDLHRLTTHRTYSWSEEYVDDLLQRFHGERKNGHSQRYVIVAASYGCVGTVELTGINSIHGHANIGITIWDPKDRKKGAGRFAVEQALGIAFDRLRLEIVTAKVFESNAPSRQLFERLGFQVAGIIPGRYFIDGARVGEVHFYLRRSPRATP